MPCRNIPSSRNGLSEGTVEELLRLHDGESGVLTLIDYGQAAIPALRSFLFRRDRSGIYQPRRWAVEALAALHAYGVLADYLRAAHPAHDPVERMGDEAVINEAARALSAVREEWVFQLLLSLIRKYPFPGLVDAIGSFGRPEAIPFLIEALAEDDCRAIAEAHLQRLGSAAQAMLMNVATRRQPSEISESETSLRQRRSALRLLRDGSLPATMRHRIKDLLSDHDATISVLACELWLRLAPDAEKELAIRQLQSLRGDAAWPLAEEIDQYLSTACKDR